MAQIVKFKTKNQIYKDFLSLVKAALLEFNITGWQIKNLDQIVKSLDLKPCVFVQVLNKHQSGAQYQTKSYENSQIINNYAKKQEIQVRFSATRRENIKDNTETYNGIDVLDVIKSYLQSDDGITMLSNLGYAQYRAGDLQSQNFINDDENVQFLPFFDCTYLYTDIWQTKVNKIEKIILRKLKGV